MLALSERVWSSLKTFRILVATDGSAPARAALATATKFPWPEPSRARGVVALRAGGLIFAGAALYAIVERNMHALVEPTRHLLALRWKGADVMAVHQTPTSAILSEARRFRPGAIVLGWRGHGRFRRLLAGSVSRSVVARSACAVLVVREAPRAVSRFIVGFDGSPAAQRAVHLLARFKPPRRGTIGLVNVVEPLVVPAATRLPASTRATLRRELAAQHDKRLERAETEIKAAAALLRRAGWIVRGHVRVGAPLATLLDISAQRSAQVLIVGARAKRGLARFLLGSVAEGALDRSPIPVLIVP